MRSMRRVPAVAGAAMTLLFVAACGGGKSSTPAGEIAVSTSTAAPPAAVATATPGGAAGAGTQVAGTAAGAAPSGTPSAAILPRTLLTTGDLPSGWMSTSLKISPDDAKPCGQDLALLTRATAQTRADFEAGSLGPFITQSVAIYPPGMAAQAMNDTVALLGRCREWKEDERGSNVTIKTSPLSFPSLGDATLPVQVEIDGIANRDGLAGGFLKGLLGGKTNLVFVRRGDAIVMIAHSAVGLGSPGVDVALTEQIARRAEQRLTEALR